VEVNMSKRSRRNRRSNREVVSRNRPRRKPQSSQRKRTPRNAETTKYIQEPIKKKNGNFIVRWVNTHVDNVRLILGILIFICSILILNNNLNIKDAYITSGQSFYSVLLMGKSTGDLTKWAREYVVTGDIKYKQAYDDHLEERNGNKADRRGVTKSYNQRFKDIPNSIVPEEDKAKLLDSLSASNLLAVKEKIAFDFVEKGDLESARECVFGDEYDEQKEKVLTPLLEFTDKLQMDMGRKIVTKIYFSYGYIILLCLSNLVLIILINDRLDLSIKDKED
tara:strand:+ start:796 stop:1632 length:837 start_codon:yes stop_codon:yes gene_type:complete